MTLEINDELYYSSSEAMRFLKISRPTLLEFVASGKLAQFRQGKDSKTIYYKKADLDRLLEIHQTDQQ